eukprot:scaffold489_cov286-Prasinococcus_capsulatus_cf.AAC.2
MVSRLSDGMPLAEGLDNEREQRELEQYKVQAKAVVKQLAAAPPSQQAPRMSFESGPYVLQCAPSSSSPRCSRLRRRRRRRRGGWRCAMLLRDAWPRPDDDDDDAGCGLCSAQLPDRERRVLHHGVRQVLPQEAGLPVPGRAAARVRLAVPHPDRVRRAALRLRQVRCAAAGREGLLAGPAACCAGTHAGPRVWCAARRGCRHLHPEDEEAVPRHAHAAQPEQAQRGPRRHPAGHDAQHPGRPRHGRAARP